MVWNHKVVKIPGFDPEGEAAVLIQTALDEFAAQGWELVSLQYIAAAWAYVATFRKQTQPTMENPNAQQ